MTIDVIFLDSGREPQCKPDPKHPDGRDVDMAAPGDKTCTFNVPYPAPRCGAYRITCRECGLKVAMTVAGRADDFGSLLLNVIRTRPAVRTEVKRWLEKAG